MTSGKEKSKTKKWLKQRLEPLEKFIWLTCCVPLLDRFDKNPKVPKSREDSKQPIGTEEQFKAYRLSKKLLLKKLGLSAIGMCLLIIFLSWLQWYIPTRNKAFWSTGMGRQKTKLAIIGHFRYNSWKILAYPPSHRFWLRSWFSVLVVQVSRC